MNEEERIQQIILDMARGDDIGHKLGIDRRTKTIRPVSIFGDPDQGLEVTPQDLDFAAAEGDKRK